MADAIKTRRMLGPSEPPTPSHDKVFGNNSWETISKCSNYIEKYILTTNSIADVFGWNIGDRKAVTFVGVNYDLRIIGFMHDNRTGGVKAGISLDLIPSWGATEADRVGMELTATNANGWHGSRMRLVTLPSYLNQLPYDLRNIIKTIVKLTGTSGTNQNLVSTHDILWCLSEAEVWNGAHVSAPGEGTIYEFYAINNRGVDRLKNQPAGTGQSWWLRSPSTISSASFRVVSAAASDNNIINTDASFARGVSFGLCV